MSKLDTLVIKDFQSHKESIIKFDPYVTAIMGLNNHGKSVILKSLRKVVRDLPKGNVFVRNVPEQAKKASIKVILDNDCVVERGVGKNLNSSTDNYYRVVDGSKEEFEYTKFSKTGIPLEVLQSLDISSPQLFGDIEIDLNFHIQKDEDFLVRGKGLSSIRSKVLSRVTGVDVAQRAIQVGKLKERNISSEIEKIRKQRQEYILSLEKYETLGDIEEDLNSHKLIIKDLESKERKILFYKDSYEKVLDIINQAKVFQEVLKSLQITFSHKEIRDRYYILVKLRKVNEVNSSLNIYLNVYNYIKRLPEIEAVKDKHYLLSMLRRIQGVYHTIQNLNNVLHINLPNTSSIRGIHSKLSEYVNVFNKLESIKMSIEEKCKEKENIERQIEFAIQELIEYKKEIKVCPVCKKSF